MSSDQRRSRALRTLVPWSEYEPTFTRLRQALGGASASAAMGIIGYAGGTHLAAWKREGVPILAVNATRWCLHDLGGTAPKERQREVFSHAELARLFALASGIPIPDEQRREVIGKIARMLTP